jgi:hypothetical protein
MATIGFAKPSPHTARFQNARPSSLRLPNLGHEGALVAPSLPFTILQSCLAAHPSSTDNALFFSGMIFR